MAISEEAATVSLKDEGNTLFKAGNFLKAAAIYTQAIKADPSNATLYSNRSAAFLSLSKVTKALSDAEMTIKLNPTWEKGYFRKGSALEAMQKYEEALTAYKEALIQNPKSTEVTRKIQTLSKVVQGKKLKSDLAQKTNNENVGEEIHKFAKEVIGSSKKEWSNKSGNLDARVYFYSDKKDNTSQEFVVSVDKAFESPDTLSSCVSFLRQYAVDTSSSAACLVVSKKNIAFPQVWKGQGSRKWKLGQTEGFFVQLELSSMRRLWFVPAVIENGKAVCRDPEQLDIDTHAVLPPLFR